MSLKNWIMGTAIAASALLSSNAQAQNRFGSVDEITSHYDSLRNAAITQYESYPDSWQSILEDAHSKRLKTYDQMENDLVTMQKFYESTSDLSKKMSNVSNQVLSNPYSDKLNYLHKKSMEIDRHRFESIFPNGYLQKQDSTRTDTKELSRSILFGND